MKRKNEFVADDSISGFLDTLNRLVSHGERNLESTIDSESNVPLFLVVGAPRSGTTVLMQWLNQIGVACPTNIAARFYKTPRFAGMLQRLLTDEKLNYRDELSIAGFDEYSSDYGKTKGLLSPHEFSYFFRLYFPVTVGEKLSPDQIRNADPDRFVEGINAFGNALGQAVAMKGLLIQYELQLLARHSQIIFIHTHRDEADNVCSLVRHRKIVAGDSDEWISVRPAEYEWLRHLQPVEQVAGQVRFTNEAIRHQLSDYDQQRFIDLPHHSFCEDPEKLFRQINEKIVRSGFPDLGDYLGPKKFNITTYDKTSPEYLSATAALGRVSELAVQKR